jgi:hypothetical protein
VSCLSVAAAILAALVWRDNVSLTLRAAKGLQKKHLIAKQEKSGSPNGANHEQSDIVRHKIRIHHEREAKEHGLPDVHPFSVNERDETDRAEEQSADEIYAAEDRHDSFSS